MTTSGATTRIVQTSRAKAWRFNPLSNLNPAALSRALDNFRGGYLREAANIFELLEERDDLLRGVVSKRKKSVARNGWAVLPVPNLSSSEVPEARRHAQALEFFYTNVECENAADVTERGSFKLLARQMMDAVGKRFAVHEIVWNKPKNSNGTDHPFVTAKFRFVPLGFFENTTGTLRFLDNESETEGTPLQPGGWMVTVGEGLMIASSTAWMFKNIALNDWLKSCQRNGTPPIIARSGSTAGSEEWNALVSALDDLVETRATIHGANDDIRILDMLPGGSLPYPELIERVDRLLAALWRGADLSTLSRDRGYGASLQEKETCALEEDDAEMITETLNRYVDAWVIRHVFGPDVRPLARVKLLVAPRECTSDDLAVDEFLLRHGAPLSLEATLNRYGRALPKPGESIFLIDRNTKASLPASSQNSWAGHMENQETGAGLPSHSCLGPNVSSRGGSPVSASAPGGSGQQEAHSPSPDESLANQFILAQDDWLQLAPYGDFPHERGLQRIDRAAAEGMVARFNSFLGRAGRLFGGVPFYVGHPDLPNASELSDRKAYGWVVELEAREDGFYGRVKWSEAGLDLLRNGHYRFLSPYWEAKESGSENGQRLYRPVALISVGLTNQPNLPVKALANEEHAAAPAPSYNPQPLANAESRVGTLAQRRHELARAQNRRDRIEEAVLKKLRLGLAYDAAWESVKREHGSLFARD